MMPQYKKLKCADNSKLQWETIWEHKRDWACSIIFTKTEIESMPKPIQLGHYSLKVNK